MKIARKKPTAANLRSWRVIIMRSRGELLGYVEAADSRRGPKRWPSSQDQRSRLLIREGPNRRIASASQTF
jgi:hypothetical protein